MTRSKTIIAEARAWIGTPYRQGASVCGVGCDCIGLVRGIWRACCGPEPSRLPAYKVPPDCSLLTDTLATYCEKRDVAEPRCGDILVFRWTAASPPAHCAILTDPGTMVHCHASRAVTETQFTRWWQRRLAAVFAFPEVSASWDS